MPDSLPIIDLESLGESDSHSLSRIAAEVGAACRDVGFFYVVNHGVEASLIAEAFARSRDFFALPVADKRIARDRGGRRQSRLFRPPA